MIDQMERFAPAYARNFNDQGKTVVFVPVHHGHEGEEGPGLGIAVANESGFHPVPKYIYATDDWHAAGDRADELNRDVLNINRDRAIKIQCSTMGGRPV